MSLWGSLTKIFDVYFAKSIREVHFVAVCGWLNKNFVNHSTRTLRLIVSQWDSDYANSRLFNSCALIILIHLIYLGRMRRPPRWSTRGCAFDSVWTLRTVCLTKERSAKIFIKPMRESDKKVGHVTRPRIPVGTGWCRSFFSSHSQARFCQHF